MGIPFVCVKIWMPPYSIWLSHHDRNCQFCCHGHYHQNSSCLPYLEKYRKLTSGPTHETPFPWFCWLKNMLFLLQHPKKAAYSTAAHLTTTHPAATMPHQAPTKDVPDAPSAPAVAAPVAVKVGRLPSKIRITFERQHVAGSVSRSNIRGHTQLHRSRQL